MVNTVYYYGIRPLQVLKVISQVHMAKIRFLDTQEETFLDISGIREIPSTDKYITINCQNFSFAIVKFYSFHHTNTRKEIGCEEDDKKNTEEDKQKNVKQWVIKTNTWGNKDIEWNKEKRRLLVGDREYFIRELRENDETNSENDLVEETMEHNIKSISYYHVTAENRSQLQLPADECVFLIQKNRSAANYDILSMRDVFGYPLSYGKERVCYAYMEDKHTTNERCCVMRLFRRKYHSRQMYV